MAKVRSPSHRVSNSEFSSRAKTNFIERRREAWAFVTITQYIRARAKVVQGGRQRPECRVRVGHRATTSDVGGWQEHGGKLALTLSMGVHVEMNTWTYQIVKASSSSLSPLSKESIVVVGGRKESSGCSILLDYMRSIHQPSGGSRLFRVRAWWHG